MSCVVAQRTDWEEVARSAAWYGFLTTDVADFDLHYTTRAALDLVSHDVGALSADHLYIFQMVLGAMVLDGLWLLSGTTSPMVFILLVWWDTPCRTAWRRSWASFWTPRMQS